MSYKDRIQNGRFRNVPFFIESHQFDGGRRLQVHEFPDRDDPYVEDLGRKARRFTLEIHLIGNDYFALRDRMIRALEGAGKGTLIHPFLGRKTVLVEDFNETEDTLTGRICRFSIKFVEQGRSISPIAALAPVFKVFQQVNDVIDGIEEEFNRIYEFAEAPGFVVESAIGVLNNASDAFTNALGIVPAVTSAVDGLKNGILDFTTSIPSIVTDSASVFAETVGLQRTLSQANNDGINKRKIQGSFFTFNDDADEIPETTPSRIQEKKNNEALKWMIQGVGIVDSVKWFSMQVTQADDPTNDEDVDLENTDIFSIGDLEKERNRLTSEIDTFVDKFEDFDTNQDFLNLKALMLKALPQPGTTTSLNKEIPVELKITLPSLVVTYDNLEDIRSEEDFVKRNLIKNPLFVQGGETYELVDVVV